MFLDRISRQAEVKLVIKMMEDAGRRKIEKMKMEKAKMEEEARKVLTKIFPIKYDLRLKNS